MLFVSTLFFCSHVIIAICGTLLSKSTAIVFPARSAGVFSGLSFATISSVVGVASTEKIGPGAKNANGRPFIRALAIALGLAIPTSIDPPDIAAAIALAFANESTSTSMPAAVKIPQHHRSRAGHNCRP